MFWIWHLDKKGSVGGLRLVGEVGELLMLAAAVAVVAAVVVDSHLVEPVAVWELERFGFVMRPALCLLRGRNPRVALDP